MKHSSLSFFACIFLCGCIPCIQSSVIESSNSTINSSFELIKQKQSSTLVCNGSHRSWRVFDELFYPERLRDTIFHGELVDEIIIKYLYINLEVMNGIVDLIRIIADNNKKFIKDVKTLFSLTFCGSFFQDFEFIGISHSKLHLKEIKLVNNFFGESGMEPLLEFFPVDVYSLRFEFNQKIINDLDFPVPLTVDSLRKFTKLKKLSIVYQDLGDDDNIEKLVEFIISHKKLKKLEVTSEDILSKLYYKLDNETFFLLQILSELKDCQIDQEEIPSLVSKYFEENFKDVDKSVLDIWVKIDTCDQYYVNLLNVAKRKAFERSITVRISDFFIGQADEVNFDLILARLWKIIEDNLLIDILSKFIENYNDKKLMKKLAAKITPDEQDKLLLTYNCFLLRQLQQLVIDYNNELAYLLIYPEESADYSTNREMIKLDDSGKILFQLLKQIKILDYSKGKIIDFLERKLNILKKSNGDELCIIDC